MRHLLSLLTFLCTFVILAQTEYPLSDQETHDHYFEDFNGDGQLDILAVTVAENTLVLYQGLGGGAFGIGVVLDTLDGFEEVGIDIGDMDGDGDVDIMALQPSAGLWVYLNDGTGQFTEPTGTSVSFYTAFFDNLQVVPFSGQCGASDVVLSDRDNDGALDATFFLQSCNFSSTEWVSFVVLGNGDGSFDTQNIQWSFYLSPVPVDQPAFIHQADRFDFNDTGDEEVLTLMTTGGSQPADILATHGEPWGYIDQEYGLDVPGGFRMKAYDLDTDGDKELFIMTATSVRAYDNLGGDVPLDEDSIVFFETGFNLNHDFDIADFNGDGLLDYMVLQNFGDGPDLFLDDGAGNYVLLNGTWYDTSEGYSTCRFFEDNGTTRLLLSSFAGTWIYTLDFVGTASGHVYLDLDGNMSYDTTDYILPGLPLNFQEELFLFSDDEGFELLYGLTGEHIIALSEYNEELFTAFEPSSYTFTLNDATPAVDELYFGLSPNGIQENLIVNVNAQSARCDWQRTHTLSLFSESNVPIGAQVAYSVSELCTIIEAPEADSIVGNTVYYSFDELFMMQSLNREIVVQIPSADFLGTIIQHTWTGTYGSAGLIEGELSQEITCGYDPNDKQEFIGLQPGGFIEEDTEYLDYLIRFQNTGNDTAFTVILDDPLDAALDPLSILVTGHSHDYELLIDPFDKAVFIFEDILLPDSSTNLEASQGFIRFQIDIDAELAPGDSIANLANIFFDTNPPIVTNTVYSRVFSCEAFGTIPMIAEDDFAGLMIEGDFDSIQWSLDGVDIAGANADSLAFETLIAAGGGGDVVVTTTDIFGCTFSSEPYDFQPEGVLDNAWEGLQLSPNPTAGVLNLSIPERAIGGQYILISITGQVASSGALTRSVDSIDMSHLPNGLYFLQLRNLKGEVQTLKVVKRG